MRFKKALTIMELRLRLMKLNAIPNVNRGGCAYVALMATQWLKQVKNLDSASVVYVLDSEALEQSKSNLDYACMHAYIKIGDKYYDSIGVRKLEQIASKHHVVIMDDEEVLRTLRAEHLWNTKFDREKAPNKIAKTFKGKFNLYAGLRNDTKRIHRKEK